MVEEKSKVSSEQTQLPMAFKQTIANNSDQAKATQILFVFYIAADMWPYSIMEDTGLKHMLEVSEHYFLLPSQPVSPSGIWSLL